MTDTRVTIPGIAIGVLDPPRRAASMPFGSTSTRRPWPTTPRISDAARSLTPENSTGHAFQLKERSSSRNTSCVRFQTQCEVITVAMPSRWLR